VSVIAAQENKKYFELFFVKRMVISPNCPFSCKLCFGQKICSKKKNKWEEGESE
jgi:hypothetical protein